MVEPHIHTRYGISVAWHENNIGSVQWPIRPTDLVHHKLEHLEGMIAVTAKATA